MSRFRIIALRIGSQVDKEELLKWKGVDFLKVLEPNTFYRFNSDYKLLNTKGQPVKKRGRVKRIDYKSAVPDSLYNQENLNISISAIVGKNGSGKSTLIEMYFVAIYLLAVSQRQIDVDPESIVNRRKQLLEYKQSFLAKKKILEAKVKKVSGALKKLKVALEDLGEEDLEYYPIHAHLQKQLNANDREKERIGDEDYFQLEEEWIDANEQEVQKVLTSINNIEIYYELDKICYCLSIDNNRKGKKIQIEVIPSNISSDNKELAISRVIKLDELLADQIDLGKHFFYTIAVSYSHYGLNSLEHGDWLNTVFHKNDGYQTPLVINPMRTEGVININRENDLVIQRLLSNLLEPITKNAKSTLRHLMKNKKATNLILRYNHDKLEQYKRDHGFITIDNAEEFAVHFYQKYTGGTEHSFIQFQEPIILGTWYYLVLKLIRICNSYDQYKTFIRGNKFIRKDDLTKYLIEDNSHITYKLKQSANYLKDKHFGYRESYNWFEKPIEHVSFSIQEIIDEEKRGKIRKTVIEFLPPPTFETRIQLDDESFFDQMSSGEKQKIHSMSSIVYHLINLNSTFGNKKTKGQKHYKYRYVNVIFDEVEQYFHPDLQRTFVADMLDYLNKINPIHVKHIEGLNMMFATHSPFILSDIPVTNILRLKEGNADPFDLGERTFGANIHELLSSGFFMDSTIGEFASKQMKSLIELHDKVRRIKSPSELKKLSNEYLKEKEMYKFLAENVGEDVIRGLIKNHLYFIEDSLKEFLSAKKP